MISLKIDRYNYNITKADDFMDNGSCVQLLSQSKEKGTWGKIPNPVLSKKMIKIINKYDRIQKPHGYSKSVQVFSLKI